MNFSPENACPPDQVEAVVHPVQSCIQLLLGHARHAPRVGQVEEGLPHKLLDKVPRVVRGLPETQSA